MSYFWHRADEWVQHASCHDMVDFTIPPVVHTSQHVEAICNTCKVRPECMEWAVNTEATGVWSAGTWLPDQETHMDQPSTYPHTNNKPFLKNIYNDFTQRIPAEKKRRGEDV